MQKKRTCQSAFLNLRTLFGLLLCAVTACFILIPIRSGLAFLRPQAPLNASQGTLTFEERVSYQRAIEEVYWRHRIWPKERPDPKPGLDAVMSQTQLEKKVADYLRNSQALKDYWQRPITADQLQAEMDRMAKHTKQPEVLQELFEALGNDPFVIAECLARPALADRLLTTWYAYDQRIHGELKRRAEADLQAHPAVEQMKQLSGKYSEIELVRSDSVQGKVNPGVGHNVKLNSHEWDETVQKLAATFKKPASRLSNSRDGSPSRPLDPGDVYQTIPIGKLSSLQEDENRYYATAVIEKTKDYLKLGTLSWLKEPLEPWLARVKIQPPRVMAVPSGDYTLPNISEGGCIEDTWTATAGPPGDRYSHTAVWTGSEMIVWGGQYGQGITAVFLDTGGRYNPGTDTWAATSGINAPTARGLHTAVWTGSEMIVWGDRRVAQQFEHRREIQSGHRQLDSDEHN